MTAPRVVPLAASLGVDLWLAELDGPPATPPAAAPPRTGLDAREEARAARFRFDLHRRRYIAAHLALRQVLGTHCGMAPAAIRLEEGEFGKPRLANAMGTGCCFSLSHSEGRALIATATAEIGVDIEWLRPLPDLAALADHCLSPAERRELEAIAPADAARRSHAFLVAWTRKEACLKALGCGLQVEPATVDAGWAPGIRDLALATPAGRIPVRVASITGIDGAVAAVARAGAEGIR